MLLATLWAWAIFAVIDQGVPGISVWLHLPNLAQAARLFAIRDVDDAVFLRDIHAHSGPGGLLYWWHHGWHGNAYPYYWRPLTMIGFWSEYHLFGAYRFDRWQMADTFFHVAFALVLAAFAATVARSSFAAPLSMIVFAGLDPLKNPTLSQFILGHTTPSASIILINWKDQPEAWGGICTLGSCMMAMKRRWGWSCALAAISVCFKESGWITYPMLLATLLFTGNLRRVPWRAWAATGLSWIILIALRASSGHNVMFPPRESTRNGWHRYLVSVLDPSLQQFMTDNWPMVVLALAWTWLIVKSRLRPLPRFAAFLGAAAVCAVLFGRQNGIDPVTAAVDFLDPQGGAQLVIIPLITFLVLATAWRYPCTPQRIAYVYSLVLLSALPEVAILQPNLHMLYLTNGLQSVLLVTVLLSCLRQIARSRESRRATVSPLGQPSIDPKHA